MGGCGGKCSCGGLYDSKADTIKATEKQILKVVREKIGLYIEESVELGTDCFSHRVLTINLTFDGEVIDSSSFDL